MKPILTPTVGAVVKGVRDTLQIWIMPSLAGKAELSYATTVAHLLSHVEHRLKDSGQLLFDEVKRLRQLLPNSIAWLKTQPDTDVLRAAISTTLDYRRDPDVYLTLDMLESEVAQLRQHVCDILVLLNRTQSVDGTKLHADLREYIAWQLEAEGKIMEAAMRGRGPRR